MILPISIMPSSLGIKDPGLFSGKLSRPSVCRRRHVLPVCAVMDGSVCRGGGGFVPREEGAGSSWEEEGRGCVSANGECATVLNAYISPISERKITDENRD